jgi:NAD(P)-dependent dehydrogenase (short-subunit alcohol dehydrogenase family)
MNKKTAIVTGANRGLGLAISKKLAADGFHVLMVGKNQEQLAKETQNLTAQKLAADFFLADISKEKDCELLLSHLSKHQINVHILINNAGIYVDESSEAQSLSFREDVLMNTMNVNTFAPYRLIKGILPLMLKNNYGRIVNVSSGFGALDGISANFFSYSVSKASLNVLTKLFASEVTSKNIKVNSVCPGWVRTDMGGPSAPRSIEEGVTGIYWAATLPSNGPNGGFFRDGVSIPW